MMLLYPVVPKELESFVKMPGLFPFTITMLCGGADKFVTPDSGTNFSEG